LSSRPQERKVFRLSCLDGMPCFNPPIVQFSLV